MKTAQTVLLVFIVLLCLAAGLAKVMQVPNEVEFFQSLGLNSNMLIAFGALQIFAGVELAIPKTRKYGIAFAAFLFLASAVMLFISGNIPFGFVSLIPVV